MMHVILTAIATIAVFMVLVFVIAQVIKNNSIVDIGWGIGFVLVDLVLLFAQTKPDPKSMVLTAMILIWGIRLALHIFNRARGKAEDFRYAEWRKGWGSHAAINAFFKVFFLQGLIMLIVAIPILVVFNSSQNQLNYFSFIGFLVFGFGLLFESVGDFQMYCFKKNSVNKGKLITTGLWKYTRHPNYFGEAVLWWGISIFTIGSDMFYLSFLGPLVLNYLLLYVSGVPLLEKKYLGNKEWEDYKNITPAFIPFIGSKA